MTSLGSEGLESTTQALHGRLRALAGMHLPVTLWAVRRRGVHERRRYQVAPVPITNEVEDRLRGVLREHLHAVGSLRPFEYVQSTDEEEATAPMVLPIADCDLGLVRSALEEALAAQHDANWDDFHRAQGYMLHARSGTDDIIGFRATKGAWGAKRRSLFGIRRAAGEYALLDESDFLHLDERLDCVSVAESVVIFDQKRFEAGLDFRDTVRQHAHRVLDEKLAPFFADGQIDILRQAIGSHLPRLRQLASLRNADHLTTDFPIRVKESCDVDRTWQIKFSETGQIIVEPDHVGDLITALCNTRLRSPLDQVLYDVVAKRPATVRAKGVQLLDNVMPERQRRSRGRNPKPASDGTDGQAVA